MVCTDLRFYQSGTMFHGFKQYRFWRAVFAATPRKKHLVQINSLYTGPSACVASISQDISASEAQEVKALRDENARFEEAGGGSFAGQKCAAAQ